MSELELYKEEMRRRQRIRNNKFNKKNKGTYKCEMCNKKYNYSSGLYRHNNSNAHNKAMVRKEGETIESVKLSREQEGKKKVEIKG